MMGDPTLDLPTVCGQVKATAVARAHASDFKVQEISAVQPSGCGEHLLVHVRKCGANTEWVAQTLARLAGIRVRDVGFAGLKDRHAVAEQWFSLHLPGRDVSPEALVGEEYQVLQCVRHGRKIRRGALRGNRFEITLRDVSGDRSGLEDRLRRLRDRGAPNYFGSQRFGRNGANLVPPGDNRPVKGIRLSAFRSFLFNAVVAARVKNHTWDRVLPGDCLLLDGSQRYFSVETVDEPLIDRAYRMDVHPTGALWGLGEPPSAMGVSELERGVALAWPEFSAVLEARRLRQERRALRMPVRNLEWHWPAAETLVLSFFLPRGSYATALLRELVHLRPTPISADAGSSEVGLTSSGRCQGRRSST